MLKNQLTKLWKRNRVAESAITFALTVALLLPYGLQAGAEGEGGEMSKPGEVCRYEEMNSSYVFNVPTQVYSINGQFFMADAYNQQMIYTDDCFNEPAKWHVMGNKLFRPHAVASDGSLYVVVDTDNNRVVTYAKNESGFQVVESFENVGVRPHYIEYDAGTKQFYVWSSMTGTMYIYKRVPNTMQLKLKKSAYIKELDGCYTRSFTIDGNNIYLPSMGRNAIYVVNKSTFRIKSINGVCAELGGMVQVRRDQNYYYLVTSSDAAGDQSKATIVRSTSLSGFVEGSYEDIRYKFPDLDGVPYYISHLSDGHYYTPVIVGQNPPYICRFDIVDNEITNVVNMKYY